MVAGVLVFPGAQPSRDRNGGSVAAELRWYANGTTTPATVYADSGLTTPLPFPVESDDAGRFVLMWADVSTLFSANWATADGQSVTYDDLSASIAADVIIAEEAAAALEEMQALVAGYSGTVLYQFSTTTTDSDPGAGKLRFNNATIGSVTQIYFDNTDLAGVSETAWLDSFDDANSGSNRGTLYARSLIDSSKFGLFYVNGAVVDGTGYRKVPVTYVSGTALPDDLTNVAIGFASAGSTGASGTAASITVGTVTTGAPASPVIVTNVGTSAAAIFDFTIPQGSPGTGNMSSTGVITAGHVAVFVDANTIQDGGVLIPGTRTVTGGGLVTGGGALSSNQVLTVTAAVATDLWTGTSAALAITPDALLDSVALVSLTSGTSIAVDMGVGFNFTVTLGHNATLSAPSNAKPGQSGVIYFIQDGTGSRTLAFNSAYRFPGGSDPTASTAAGSVDILAYIVRSSSVIDCVYTKAFA